MCTSNKDDRKLDCCSVVQSPLFRWKYILHFICKSGSQSLEEVWRDTESMLLEVQCEVSTVSDDLDCHVICWCWSIVFFGNQHHCTHLPGNVRALHASFCWQALWRCWVHFPAGLGTCPHCQRTKSWFNDHVLLCLIGQQTHLTWTPENLDERHQTQQCRWPEEPVLHYTWAVPRRIDAVIHAKGGPTKYWVHRIHTFQKPDISV